MILLLCGVMKFCKAFTRWSYDEVSLRQPLGDGVIANDLMSIDEVFSLRFGVPGNTW